MATLKTRIQLRNDSAANWKANETVVLKPGEVGIESDTNKMKLGDGSKTWAELPYFKGDIDLTKLEANNVFFGEDIVFTEPVGTVTIGDTGSTTVHAEGVSLDSFLKSIFAKEDSEGLLKTAPTLSVSGNGVADTVEVGTTITPNAKTTFTAGKYKYGPDTGCTASGYKITSVTVPSEFKDATTATFNPYKMASDGAIYQVKAECTCSEGAIPKSNTGNPYEGQRIKEQTLKAGPVTICTARYHNFYGYNIAGGVALSPEGLTSTVIRGLQEKGQWSNENPKSSYAIDEKWMQFFYAIPTSAKTMTAKDSNNITLTVQKIQNCKVTLPDGTQKDYDVFVIDNAAKYSPTTIQMSWK